MIEATRPSIDFDAKKLMRSLLVFAPWIQDLRFRGEARVLQALGQPFRAEFAGLRALTLTDPLVVDIGCNRGISISTFLSMRPDARVVGFEANPDLAAATKAMFSRDPRVEIRSMALGDRPAKLTLHVPVYRGYRFDGLGSMDAQTARALFDGRLLYWFDPRRLVVEEKPVAVRRLDDEHLDPDVIKLYVQGHEAAVLDGARDTLARNEPIVIAPSRTPHVDALLRAQGYGRYQWQRDRFVPEADFGYVVYYMTPARARSSGTVR